MLRLVSKQPLSEAARNKLAALQQLIDAEPTFEAKVAKAQSLWKAKRSAQEKEDVFNEITDALKAMCVAIEGCVYCEHNEASDLEHIEPKSFFPGKTFVWENYLLACKTCNSGYKLDKCYTLDSVGNVAITHRGQEPQHATIAFINPRTEDPAQLILLNTSTFRFAILENLSLEAQHKAAKTLEILELNTRTPLIDARKKTGKYYWERLDKLAKIMAAQSSQEIFDLLSPYDEFYTGNETVEALKSSISAGFKKDIQTHAHPSVWHAIKTIDSKVTPKWKALFEALPEALNW